MNKTIWTTLFIVGLSATLLVAKEFGVYTQTQIPMDNAVVTLSNAAPDVGAIDVYIDRSPVIEDLQMGNAAVYIPVAPGNHLVDVFPAGGNTVLIKSTEVAFEAGHTYDLTLDGLKADWSVALGVVDEATK